MDLSSSTTKDNAFGGKRGGVVELFDDGIAFFTNDVEDMSDLTKMNPGVINDEDINAMMKKTTKLLNEKSDVQVRKMYTRYQNLWTDFFAKKCER